MASSDTDAHRRDKAGARPAWQEWLRNPGESVPTLAVVTLVVTAVLTSVMVTRSERQAEQAQSSAPPPAVAQAPQPPDAPGAAAMRLGAGPACGNCGVIESVAMRSRSGGYRMRIRMDDGSVRTVEQRDALLAGSRVVLEGNAVRVLPGSPQG